MDSGILASTVPSNVQPAAWRNLGLGSDLEINPSSATITGTGSSYAAGDFSVLTCSGTTASSSPKIGVATVSGGAVQKLTFVLKGVFTAIPTGGAVNCSQASTTGSGVGLTLTAQLEPVSSVTLERLANGTGSGNTFVTSPEGGPNPGLYGVENTFVGFWSGGCVSGGAAANTGIGGLWAGGGVGASHNCPLGLLMGSYNTVVGDDSMYNTYGAVGSDTMLGQNTGRNMLGNNNTCGGQAACSPPGVANTPYFTGNYASVWGFAAAQSVTSASQFDIFGAGVGSTTFATGTNVMLFGTSSFCDTPAGNTSDFIRLCGGLGSVLDISNTATPSSSLFDIKGNGLLEGGILQLGGTTASFPELRISGTLVEFRLADNSAYATIDSGGNYVGANNAALVATGNLGEQADTIVGAGSAVTISNDTATPIASVPLSSAGDWLLYGNICFAGSGAVTVNYYEAGLNNSNASMPAGTALSSEPFSPAKAIAAGSGTCLPVQPLRYHASGSGSIYLMAYLDYNTGSGLGGYGEIHVDRLR